MKPVLEERFVAAVEKIADALTQKKNAEDRAALSGDAEYNDALNARHYFLMATLVPSRDGSQASRDEAEENSDRAIERLRIRAAARQRQPS